jgi:hypothetical protein
VEHDAYRWWTVRDIVWCSICVIREENGRGAGLCAVCQSLDSELEEMCRNSSSKPGE